MWLFLVLAAAALGEESSLKSTTESYTWRLKVAEHKKVSGFLLLDAASTVLRVDMEVKSGDASMFISVEVGGEIYTWNSTEVSHHVLILRSSDPVLQSDGLGLQRKFQIGAVGHAPGRSSVCLTISVTSDYEGEEHAAETFALRGSQQRESCWCWPAAGGAVLLGALWCLRTRKRSDDADLRVHLL